MESSIIAKISEEIDDIIDFAIKTQGFPREEHPALKLLSIGELVDRLSIVNFKLYKLKCEVALKAKDKEFCAEAALEDIRLVEERARLKACIDEKFMTIVAGKHDFNKEVKHY